MVISIVASDIRNATRKAIGLLKLTGNGAAPPIDPDADPAWAKANGGSAAGAVSEGSGTSGSKTGRPHKWQKRALSASFAPQVQFSGLT